MENWWCYCQTAHNGTWPYITFRLIRSATVFWSIIELLIGELYNQGRCDRHARQLYDSVVGNSGDIFFATCFRQIMIFCAKFYFSAQMATMAIGNANPAPPPTSNPQPNKTLKHVKHAICRMRTEKKQNSRRTLMQRSREISQRHSLRKHAYSNIL